MFSIPKEKWKETFDRLSRLHIGWLTSIQTLNMKADTSYCVEKVSLAGIVFIKQNTQELIELIVGDSLDNHRTFTIFDPQYVSLDEENNSQLLINIQNCDATQILIKLQPDY